MTDRHHSSSPDPRANPAVVADALRKRLRHTYGNLYLEDDVIVTDEAGWRAQPEYGDPGWRVIAENGFVLAFRARASPRDEEMAVMQAG